MERFEGFDPRWADPTDYVLGVTKAIWEDREIGGLTHWYGDGIIVRSPASIVVGNAGVIGATMATLAEFPNRQLLGEDVIWCDAGTGGFLSSHRLISTATHLHDGAYGAASGTTFRYRIIADCHCKGDVIDDEWLIRDQGAIVHQMGAEPKRYAADLIAAEGGADACVQPFTPARDIAGPYTGAGNDNPWGARLADVLRRMMAADFAVIPADYDRAAQLHYPGGRDAEGWDGADRFWMGLRAAFPSAAWQVHHTIGREDPLMPPRASARWSLTGRHDGWGLFGRPTGAPVHVMGLTHAEFGPRGLRREFTLIDEVAIWKQILLETG